jgi:hypothetical protein
MSGGFSTKKSMLMSVVASEISFLAIRLMLCCDSVIIVYLLYKTLRVLLIFVFNEEPGNLVRLYSVDSGCYFPIPGFT